MVEEYLFSGNVWLIIGLILAIIELSNGTLIVFLPMGCLLYTSDAADE